MLFFNSKKRARPAANVRNKPGGAARGGARRRVPRWMAAALALTFAAAAAAGGAWAHHHFYLCRDGRYALRHLDIGPGVLYPPEALAEFLQIGEGQNIFQVCDIAERRKHLLETGHAVKEVSLTRVLPDRLVVRTVEREPVARIAGKKPLLVDGEGVVFAGAWPKPLPDISGAGKTLEPGARLRDMGRASALFARVLQSTGANLPVQNIDAAMDDYLTLTLTGSRRMYFAWEGIGRGDAEGPLRDHLGVVAALVANNPTARSFDVRKKTELYAKE